MGCCCCAKIHNACNKFKENFLKDDGGRPCSSFYPSKIPAFFKIMIGDFAEAMVIPPKFARTLQGTPDKSIYLEDSNGNCWRVKLRTIDGSLTFKEGWKDFVLHHSISFGEIVIFKHISTSFFSVQVFGTSGSERLQFEGNGNINNCKRKQYKNEMLPDILRLSKAQKSFEDNIEKIDYRENENSNIHGGKRKKKEIGCEMLCLGRAQKRHEDKGKHCSYDKDSSKKCKVEKISSCDKDSDELAARDSPIILSDDDENTDTMILSKRCKKMHEKKPAKEHVKNGKGTLPADNRPSNNYLHITKRKSSIAHEDAVQNDEEVVKIIPTTPINHETFQNKKNPEDTDISKANERNIAQYENVMAVDHIKNKEGDVEECNIVHAAEKEKEKEGKGKGEGKWRKRKRNIPQPETFQSKRSINNDAKGLGVNEEPFPDRISLEIPKPTSAAYCAKREIKSHNEAPEVHKATMKDRTENGKISSDSRSEFEKFLNKLDDLEIVGHNHDRREYATPNYIEDGDRDLTISKEFARKSLSSAADKDSKEKLEVSRDATISLCAIQGYCNVLYVDAVGVARKSLFPSETSPQAPSNTPILNCNGSVQHNPQPSPHKENLENYGDPSEAKSKLVNRDASISLCAIRGNCKVLYVDAFGVARKSLFPTETRHQAPSNTPILNCNRSVQQNRQPSPCKENLENYADPSEAKSKSVNRDASFGLCAIKRDCNVLHVDAVGASRKRLFPSESSPQGPSNTPILNCNISVQQNPQPSPRKDNLENYGDPSEAKPKAVNRDASISLCAIKGDRNVLYMDAVGVARKRLYPLARKRLFSSETSPQAPSNTPILNCNGSAQHNPQPRPCKESLENYGDPLEAKPKPVKSNPAVMEVQPFQYVSNEFPEGNANKITPCSNDVLRAVKTEILDSDPAVAPDYVEFSTSVTLNSESWLLLPERLPACLFRRKCLNYVVLLQDPSMKLWPVLYHDGPTFIGFVDGWEDFAIANNLHHGNTCQIESIDAFEPTLKVQLSKAQNLDSLA